jgi:hypothetical protein
MRKAAGVLIMGIIGLAISACGSSTTSTVVQHETDTATVTAIPTVTHTATVHATVTQTVAPPALTVARYSGSANWNSPQFTVSGDPLTVTFSYSNNQDSNFIVDIKSSNDDQSVANEIGTSATKTTTIYPDTSSGDTAYHVEITAQGNWTIVIKQ